MPLLKRSRSRVVLELLEIKAELASLFLTPQARHDEATRCSSWAAAMLVEEAGGHSAVHELLKLHIRNPESRLIYHPAGPLSFRRHVPCLPTPRVVPLLIGVRPAVSLCWWGHLPHIQPPVLSSGVCLCSCHPAKESYVLLGSIVGSLGNVRNRSSFLTAEAAHWQTSCTSCIKCSVSIFTRKAILDSKTDPRAEQNLSTWQRASSHVFNEGG